VLARLNGLRGLNKVEMQSMMIRDPGDRRAQNIHYDYVTDGETVNQHYYVEVLKRLRLVVCRKRPKKRESRAWALHHDNEPAHTARSGHVLFKQFIGILWFRKHPIPLKDGSSMSYRSVCNYLPEYLT
jgi:hypothetical protein